MAFAETNEKEMNEVTHNRLSSIIRVTDGNVDRNYSQDTVPSHRIYQMSGEILQPILWTESV